MSGQDQMWDLTGRTAVIIGVSAAHRKANVLVGFTESRYVADRYDLKVDFVVEAD